MIQYQLIPSVRQHLFDPLLVALGHYRVDVEITLSFIRLLRQYVTRVRMSPLELASCGRAKSLRGTFVCF